MKSAGSYDAAKDTERNYLTCDENGFAETKDLPYGIYTVHQVKGWDGRELCPILMCISQKTVRPTVILPTTQILNRISRL